LIGVGYVGKILGLDKRGRKPGWNILLKKDAPRIKERTKCSSLLE